MFCKYCGNKISGNSLFCSNCGTKVDETLNNNNSKQYVEVIRNHKTKKFKLAILGLSIIMIGILLFLFFNKAKLGNAINIIENYNSEGNTTGNLISDGMVAIENDWIYYSDINKILYKMKTDGSQKAKIGKVDISSFRFLNVIDGWIYFSECTKHDVSGKFDNSEFTLYKMKIDGSQKTALTKVIRGGMYTYIKVVGDKVYYTEYNNDNKKNTVYQMKTDGSDRKALVTSSDEIQFDISEDWIYYNLTEGSTRYLCKIKTDGSEQIKLLNINREEYINTLCINVVDDWIYYATFNDGKIYKIKTDGSNNKEITVPNITRCWYINVVGDRIYYTGDDIGGECSVYKMKLDGSENTTVSKPSTEVLSNVSIAGDWIFYKSGLDIYKVKMDGSSETKVN